MSFLKRFSSLRWKLVFSYVIVTLLIILVLEGIVIFATGWLDLRFVAEWDSQSASGLSPLNRRVRARPAGTSAALRNLPVRSPGIIGL